MTQRAKRLRTLMDSSKRTANQAQSAFMRAEDVLTDVTERENRRAERRQGSERKIEERSPAIRKGTS